MTQIKNLLKIRSSQQKHHNSPDVHQTGITLSGVPLQADTE